MWTNAAVLLISLFLLKQDRDIISTYSQQKKEILNRQPESPKESHVSEVKISNELDDWKQSLTGKWKIIRQENAVESWYPMAGINFLIRPIALSVLLTLIKTIKISNNILEIERSFNGKKYWKASIKIGISKDTAEILETDVDGVKCYFCCYVNDDEKALMLEFEPFDLEKGIRVIHRREVLPNGELKMVCILSC